jgi:ribulose 1,5-bisphosphate synthetase/thiazole synthase
LCALCVFVFAMGGGRWGGGCNHSPTIVVRKEPLTCYTNVLRYRYEELHKS